jgi:type IV pilus assembly protein PilA
LSAYSFNRSARDPRRPLSRAWKRPAERTRDDAGFTLVEMLIVVLIIGILAAIAIPSFISQTGKASDAAAKTQVGTLQTTMRIYAMNNAGGYEGATLAKLETIEPTLKDRTTAIAEEVVNPTASGFTLESEAVGTKDVYTLKVERGEVTRSCTPESKGGCKGGSW